MCPSKPKVEDPPPVPDPAPPLEKTATDFKRDSGRKTKQSAPEYSGNSRADFSDLRVDLNIPGTGLSGLQV